MSEYVFPQCKNRSRDRSYTPTYQGHHDQLAFLGCQELIFPQSFQKRPSYQCISIRLLSRTNGKGVTSSPLLYVTHFNAIVTTVLDTLPRYLSPSTSHSNCMTVKLYSWRYSRWCLALQGQSPTVSVSFHSTATYPQSSPILQCPDPKPSTEPKTSGFPRSKYIVFPWHW